MNPLNKNFRLKNGNYFVEDTLSENAYVHIVLAKNPMNISETRVSVVGRKEGVPPADFMPIAKNDVLKLQRQQNLRNAERMGW